MAFSNTAVAGMTTPESVSALWRQLLSPFQISLSDFRPFVPEPGPIPEGGYAPISYDRCHSYRIGNFSVRAGGHVLRKKRFIKKRKKALELAFGSTKDLLRYADDIGHVFDNLFCKSVLKRDDGCEFSFVGM